MPLHWWNGENKCLVWIKKWLIITCKLLGVPIYWRLHTIYFNDHGALTNWVPVKRSLFSMPSLHPKTPFVKKKKKKKKKTWKIYLHGKQKLLSLAWKLHLHTLNDLICTHWMTSILGAHTKKDTIFWSPHQIMRKYSSSHKSAFIVPHHLVVGYSVLSFSLVSIWLISDHPASWKLSYEVRLSQNMGSLNRIVQWLIS